MESSERGEDGLGGGGGGESLIAKPTPSRPTNLNIPPRNPSEAFQKTSDVTPSPLTFVSSFFAEQEPDFKCETFSQMLAGAMSPLPPPSSQSTTGALENGSCVSAVGVEEKSTAAALTSGEPVQRGSAGSASSGRPNVARFKLMTPSRLPIPRSPYLTIPPGLSPTTLLDSPVLLSTKQAEPSPTTGTFPLPPISQGSGSAIVPALDSSSEKSSDQDGGAAFVFKPVAKIGRSPPSPLAKMGTGQPQLQAQGQIGTLVSSGTSSASFWDAPKLVAPLQSRVPVEIASNTAEKTEPVSQPLAPVHPPLVERPSEDGFNWRKYGQKQVKGSEFPRSYYKCTHPNCPVKKKVERSYDGQVTEIVYKGEHNHLKPQSTRRMSMAAHAANGSLRESSYGAVKADGSFEHNVDGVSARSQVVSLSSGATQTPEPSSGSTSDEEVDGEGSKVEDGDDDDPDSKRRKKASGETASIPPLRTIREPRVVVQTTSEVDILDDGYRWRKYGQKVVKGNPHPRSYYKCTNLGCSVRKHVERSSTDIRAVITTYEGKHNHDVPAARNSNNHDNSHGTTAASNSLPSHASLGTSNTIQPARPTPSLQDQYLVGKMLEDRMKGDDRGAGALELGGGHMRNAPLPSRGQGDTLMPMPMSFMNPGLSALQRADSIGQSVLLRPKDEQDEANLSSSSWPAAFLSSSATHSMTQRLAEGH